MREKKERARAFMKGVLLLLTFSVAGGCGVGGLFGHPPTIWYVKVGGSGSRNGLSWENAMAHPQDAIGPARYGDEIWVAEGTYTDGNSDGAVLNNVYRLRIYGGFAGNESNFYQREWWAHETILDGEGISYHVVTGEDDVRLDGFTITGGNANGSDPDDRGGGMYIEAAVDLTVANCIFTGNHADSLGGAISVRDHSSVLVRNCVFRGNSSSDCGGGIYTSRSTTVVNCTFQGNTASVAGGAIAKSPDAKLTVTNSILWGNSPDQLNLESERYFTMTYSCIWNGWSDAGNIGSGPLFVSAPGDLHLQPSSPCIDAADGDAAPKRDIEGNDRYDYPSRPNTGRGSPDYADMGAYEYR